MSYAWLASVVGVLLVDSLLADPLGRLLVAVVLLGVIVLIGRIVLHVAWRLLVIAAIVIGVLYLASVLLDVVGMIAV